MARVGAGDDDGVESGERAGEAFRRPAFSCLLR
jgi:hypothetical protein